ncbi:ABC transporter permease [Microlunatus soli]|uniref:Peptide/nickel transport system permease protein n=1 Tax=Microlunatus soli TaxID=630515 RepID=A0A1H1WYC4_9ACTN|nr:ABC transporter permease [Microlunatus soli]SDT01376.1 peptide/nickel transport system permease protein [Microlunatus soli]
MDFLKDFWRILRDDTTALVGGSIVVIYLLVAIFGPMLFHVEDLPMSQPYLGPSLKHPLGTDFLGNDTLTSLVVGTRPVIEVGLATAVIVISVGVVVGLFSGYVGGVADYVIMRVTDIFLTIPGLPLIIVIASIVHTQSPWLLAVILSVTAWAGLARAVRSQALSIRTSDFIDAARAQNLRMGNIIGRQLLPNVGPYVAIHFLLAVTGAIYAQVGLFVLGIAPVSGTNWGTMINLAVNQGALYTSDSMTYLFAPMTAIVLLQMALVMFSRALDKVFNPRLRVQ